MAVPIELGSTMSTPRNPVGWFELYVTELARARAFYEAVLARPLETMESPIPGMEMVTFGMDPEAGGCGGALVKMDRVTPGGSTLVYFSCDDCATEAGRVEASGGRITQPKFPIGPYGFVALCVDSEGNMFGLHSMQ
jgi:hypothetical protein